MKIAIVSSSLSPNSLSRKVLKKILNHIPASTFIDLRDLSLLEPYWRHQRDEEIYHILKQADGIIIWGGVYNYSINDSLKVFLDNYFDQNMLHKSVGIVLAGGGPKSFLVWQHLAQILMNEWHMFVWPHTLYVTKNQFDQDEIMDKDLKNRLEYFAYKFPLFVKAIKNLKIEMD